MKEELELLLEKFAEKRADEVFDSEIFELRDLVTDGAKWMYEQIKE